MPILAVILQFFLNRAAEPSTHAGLAVLAQALAALLPAGLDGFAAPAANVLSALFASLAVILQERGKPGGMP